MSEPKRRGPVPGKRRLQISADLERRLNSGEFPAGKPLPSYRQLAKEYRAGMKTIRLTLQALKRAGRIVIHPRQHSMVRTCAHLPALMAQAIALVFNSRLCHLFDGELSKAIWRGVVEGLRHSDSTLVILQHWSRWRTEFPAGLRELPLKGILLVGPFSPGILKHYELIGVPVVLLDQPGAQFKFHSVAFDNFKAAFEATSRLIAMGHSRLGFVRTVVSSLKSIDPDAKERQSGFVAACTQAGLKEHHYRILSWALNSSAHELRALLRETPRCTAIVTCTPRHAIQAASAAQDAGLRVPGGLSIVTFNAGKHAGRSWSGPVLDFEKIGRLGIEILERRPSASEQLRINTEWHNGDSHGPPRPASRRA